MNIRNIKKYIILLSVSLASLNALAGIGTISQDAVTETSIDFHWSTPSGDYQLSGSTPHYKICFEEQGTAALICNANPPQTSNNNMHTLSGLNSNTTYRIRVKCHCERRNVWGNWKNPKWRNIATVAFTTNEAATTPSYIASSLLLSGPTFISLDATLTHNDMALFSSVRVCYKKKYSSMINFNYKCAVDPFGYWLYSDHNMGWMEDTPAQPLLTTIHPFADLKPCTKYDVVGFGFYIGGGYDMIGEAQGKTNGNCGFFNKSQLIVNDHIADVLVSYAKRIDSVYRNGLFEHLATNYDKNLQVAQKAVLEQYGEDIGDTLTLLTFLVESESTVYDQWQKEEYLISNGLSIERFMQSDFPQLSRELDEELLVRGNDWGNLL